MYRMLTLASAKLHYPSVNKLSLLSTWANRARVIGDKENWNSFILHSDRTATVTDILYALNPPERQDTSKEDLTSVAFFPFVSFTFNHINSVLSKCKITTVGLLPEVISYLQPVKNDLGLKTPGMYSIPCECGKVYIGKTGHAIENRIKRAPLAYLVYHLEKLAMTKHYNLGHYIQFHGISILAKKSKYVVHIIKKVTEIELQPGNLKREGDFSLSRSWMPLIQTLKE
jgi:hypothetical protein